MVLGTAIIVGALFIAAATQDAPSAPPRPDEPGILAHPQATPGAATEPEIALRARTAQFGVDLEKPESLYDLVGAIERSFGTKISIEPLPEHCAGADQAEPPLEPFAIARDEGFDDVIARLEAASQGRWVFEEIRGVPLLRPNTLVEGHGTLLDTVVTAKIEAASVWEAICALARAVNRANNVQRGQTRPLQIYLAGPAALRHPPAILIEKRPIALALSQVRAREALCAIFEQLDVDLYYLYNCVVGGRTAVQDYVTINLVGQDGRVIDGGRIRGEEYKTLQETVNWMSEDDVLAVQSPALDNADAPAKP